MPHSTKNLEKSKSLTKKETNIEVEDSDEKLAQVSRQNEQLTELTVGFQGIDSDVIHVVCYGLPPPDFEFWRGTRQHPGNILTI